MCILQVTELQEQLQQKTDLVSQLEEDLLSIRQTSAHPHAAAAGSGAAVNRDSMDGRSPRGTSATGSSDLGRAASTAAAVAAAAGGVGDWGGSGGEGAAGEGSESMLRVLVGQRDRLRAKVQELEVALAGSRSEAAAAQQQLAAARADNVALIERLRYVGGYRQQMAAARQSEGVDVEAGSGADVVGKYSQLYDDGINPFRQFQVHSAGLLGAIVDAETGAG
jgi:homeobox protein cut-like